MRVNLRQFVANLREFVAKQHRSTLFTFFCGSTIILGILFMVLLAPFLTPYSPTQIVADMNEPPSNIHPMGTDTLGRDIFSRILWGGRASLLVAFIATMISLSVGSMTGATSGYWGGKFDRVLSLFMDALYAFPSYIMALIIAVVLSPTPENIAIAVGVSYIPEYFRVVRSIALSLKEKTFIDAERAIGTSSLRIIRRHILPYTVSSIVVMMSISIADAILAVSGLGFIGLGIQPPAPEWGTDVRWGRGVFLTGDWWIALFPGIMIFLAVVGFNLLGEGLGAMLRERED